MVSNFILFVVNFAKIIEKWEHHLSVNIISINHVLSDGYTIHGIAKFQTIMI